MKPQADQLSLQRQPVAAREEAGSKSKLLVKFYFL
jgi:hypothetical protein